MEVFFGEKEFAYVIKRVISMVRKKFLMDEERFNRKFFLWLTRFSAGVWLMETVDLNLALTGIFVIKYC